MRKDGAAQLLERARQGDREAFARLYEPVERPLAAFLFRLTASRQDAQDLAQDAAVQALENIERLEDVSFRAWIFRIAVQAALEFLRARKPWDPDAQLRVAGRLGAGASAGRELLRLHGARLHTTYNVREHIDFCFTCMGRSLPPHEQAALLLVEIHGLPPDEVAAILGISEPVLEFRLQQARQSLAEHYESRCSLTNRDGVCKQCAELDGLFHKDRRHTEQALFQIELGPRPTARERAATLRQRLAIVSSVDPLHAEGVRLHDFLMDFTRKVNGYR